LAILPQLLFWNCNNIAPYGNYYSGMAILLLELQRIALTPQLSNIICNFSIIVAILKYIIVIPLCKIALARNEITLRAQLPTNTGNLLLILAILKYIIVIPLCKIALARN
jgi:hypothetical protein